MILRMILCLIWRSSTNAGSGARPRRSVANDLISRKRSRPELSAHLDHAGEELSRAVEARVRGLVKLYAVAETPTRLSRAAMAVRNCRVPDLEHGLGVGR